MAAAASLYRTESRWGLYHYRVDHPETDNDEWFVHVQTKKGEDGMLQPDAIADAYWTLHRQDRSTWSLELDLRPYKEPF